MYRFAAQKKSASLVVWMFLMICLAAISTNNCVAQIGITLPAGFSIEQIGSDELATNVFCLTTGPRGEIVVSGPGYIRQLIDEDSDGKLDSFHQLTDGPKSGAQGLWCDENILLCTGDGGLWKYELTKSENGRLNFSSDAPTRLFEIKTGGEHHSHAIRRGPDGWFYLLCGNQTPIAHEFYAGEYSPVRDPQNGFLMRISPDFEMKEVVAHGFRNAYDFDFNDVGEIFVYDSDGERDISLPWYRPTRVFRVQPGDDAGWVTRSWKRPSFYFDMMSEIGAFGRGSPTGVEVYKSNRFPAEYDHAIFAADWTFGRIVVLKRNRETGQYDRGTPFAVSNGSFGFAVTDLATAIDGSLLVSVGGRGTGGAIYRIRSVNKDEARKKRSGEPDLRLQSPFVSRDAWTPDGLATVLAALNDRSNSGSIVALESLVGRTNQFVDKQSEITTALIEGLEKNLSPFDPERAKLVYRIASQLPAEIVSQIRTENLPVVSQLIVALSVANETTTRSKLLAGVIDELQSGEHQIHVCRIGQLTLGGAGVTSAPEMFQGYTSVIPLDDIAIDETFAASLVTAIQIADKNSDRDAAQEIGRLAAILQIDSPDMQSEMAAQLTRKSPPVDDIHWLNCLAQTGAFKSNEVALHIGRSLSNIDLKIANKKLNTDRQWIPQMRQLTARLFQQNDQVIQGVIKSINGRDSQSFLFDEMPEKLKSRVGVAFVSRVTKTLDTNPEMVTQNQVRIVASMKDPGSRKVLRRCLELDHLRDTVTLALALQPNRSDRAAYLDGLGSLDATIVKQSAIALRRCRELSTANDRSSESESDVLLLALKASNRIGWDKQDVSVRDQIVMLLRLQTGKDFGYRLKLAADQSAVMNQWNDWAKKKYPQQYEAMVSDDQANILERIGGVNWAAGNPMVGKRLYSSLKCAQCHDGGSRLGPRLEGVTKRFNRTDLFRAIIEPAGQIPDRYRATLIETVDGKLISGIVIYESTDGVTLQGIDGSTMRINADNIEAKTVSQKSLMPQRLLDDATPENLADLYAYLQSL